MNNIMIMNIIMLSIHDYDGKNTGFLYLVTGFDRSDLARHLRYSTPMDDTVPTLGRRYLKCGLFSWKGIHQPSEAR